jgi:hypothetical protein
VVLTVKPVNNTAQHAATVTVTVVTTAQVKFQLQSIKFFKKFVAQVQQFVFPKKQ